jgi:hypothetical protein
MRAKVMQRAGTDAISECSNRPFFQCPCGLAIAGKGAVFPTGR